MRAKIKLILLLLLPSQLVVNLLFAIGMIAKKATILEIIVGLTGCWLLYFAISIFSLWWMTYATSFHHDTIFAIRLDNYEHKLLQKLYAMPKKVITVVLLFGFLLAVFTDHVYDPAMLNIMLSAISLFTIVSGLIYSKIGRVQH